jgi:hypothetical protein
MVIGYWLSISGVISHLPFAICHTKFKINFLLTVNLSVNLTTEKGIRQDQRANFALPRANSKLA